MKRVPRRITALLFLFLLFPLPLPGVLSPGDGLLTVRAEAAGAPSDGGFPSDNEITATIYVSSIGNMRPADAVSAVRQAIRERREEAAVCYHMDRWFTSQAEADAWTADASAWYEQNWKIVIRAALEHTGNPDEGDYLFYHLKSYTSGCGLRANENGADIVLLYTFTYLSDAAEEEAVAERLKTVMPSLSLDGMTEAGKTRAIYRWITENVTFDEWDDRMAYSAYGALIHGRAVCQGFANLFYRMALTAGLDVRIISGTGMNGGPGSDASGPHAWNIVRIGDLYYNLDAAWDAGRTSWRWFLLGSDSFDGEHIAENTERLDYTSPAFRAAYPVPARDYDGPFGDENAAPPAPEPPAEPVTPISDPPAEPITPGAEIPQAEVPGWINPFYDVSEADVFYDAVRFVCENGLFNGVSEHLFAPELTMTRAMFVTVLGRMAGVEADFSRQPSFTDTAAGVWYSPYVDWAAENGYILGYGNGLFGPDDPVTREQAALITARMAASEGFAVSSPMDLSVYDSVYDPVNDLDDPVSPWARDAVAWTLDQGLYPMEDGRLLPQAPAPRSFVARMLAGYAAMRMR